MMKNHDDNRYQVSVSTVAQILQYLAHQGIDTAQFLKAVDLDASLLKQPDGRIPVEKYIEVEEKAAGMTCDPCFGLHMGQFAEAGSWSILGYMMMNCKTVLEAFQKFSRYSYIIGNLIKGEISYQKDRLIITLTEPLDAPRISRHCYEGYFSSLVRLARSITGRNLCPVEVRFKSGRPEHRQEYTRVFGATVRFGQDSNAITFEREAVETPIAFPNESLLNYFESYAKEFLERITCENSYTYQTKRLILSYMDAESLTIGKIARAMAISVRTLQANLAREGTDFNALLKETRQQLARKYLSEQHSTEDITYLLGFSDPSVFRKAFKKWFGMTISEYRESHQLHPGI